MMFFCSFIYIFDQLNKRIKIEIKTHENVQNFKRKQDSPANLVRCLIFSNRKFVQM